MCRLSHAADSVRGCLRHLVAWAWHIEVPLKCLLAGELPDWLDKGVNPAEGLSSLSGSRTAGDPAA